MPPRPRAAYLPSDGDGRGEFRIEVDDASLGPARIRRYGHLGGRGLLLVAQLATRWGTTATAGKPCGPN
ncbi:hypothetical protein ABZV91_30145 [Nocardia sp. NPDC004568]|uniref:hypothetical protein n=1 Tax=Nocardia sp. NPDC004568 TaxID=3154551 RepID=UPI0033B61D71